VSSAVTLALPYRDPSVTPKCHAAETPTIKGVTLGRDTSNPLREIEVSRYVWTALVRLVLTLARPSPLTAAASRYRPLSRPKPALGPLGGSATDSTVGG
jgi:hypothetical protein